MGRVRHELTFVNDRKSKVLLSTSVDDLSNNEAKDGKCSSSTEVTCIQNLRGNLFDFGEMQKNLGEIHSTEIKKRRKYGRFHSFSHHQFFYLATMFHTKHDCRTLRKPKITLSTNALDDLVKHIKTTAQDQQSADCSERIDRIAVVDSDPCASSHVSLQSNVGELSQLFSTTCMSSTVDDEALSVSAVVRPRPFEREFVTLSVSDSITSNFGGLSINDTTQMNGIVTEYNSNNEVSSPALDENLSVNALSEEIQRINFHINSWRATLCNCYLRLVQKFCLIC